MRRLSKLPTDINQRAAESVKASTDESNTNIESVKDYLARIGHNGGLKGGPARAKKLNAKRRSAIARLGGLAKAKRKKAPK